MCTFQLNKMITTPMKLKLNKLDGQTNQPYLIENSFLDTLQSVRKNEPCDVIKGRDERRSGKENPLKRDGYIDVTRLIFSDTL